MYQVNHFNIKNELDDGACLFRCMADHVYNNQILKMEDDILQDVVPEYRKKHLSLSEQTDIAERLQEIIVNWIINNYTFSFNSITISELIYASHEICSKNEYKEIYDIFAGEEDFYYTDIGLIYKSGKKKGTPKLVKIERTDRWGGLPEIIAFSQIFECPVQIFVLQRIRKKDNKKIISNSVKNDSFFSLWTEVNMVYKNTPANFLLLEKKNAHYKYLEDN